MLLDFANELMNTPLEQAINNPIFSNKAKEYLSLLENRDESITNTFSSDDIEIFSILFHSFLYYVDRNSADVINILNTVSKNKSITHYTKFFYLFQTIRLGFLDNKLSSNDEFNKLTKEIYEEIFYSFKAELNLTETHIPANKRNKDIIFIITNQLLSLEHAPTKTALDRAFTLAKYFNKQILLINTADMLTIVEAQPFFNLSQGNIFKQHSEINTLAYNSISFQFYQPKEPMPNKETMKEIIDCVLQYKPYFVLNIGGTNPTADLCSLFVPTISQATVFSGLPLTMGTFSVTANPKLKTADNILQTTFTFEYKPQTHTYTRSDLSLPEDKFLIIVSGGRLTEEVTYEFLDSIREIFNYNAHIAFAGVFDTYETIISKDEVFKDNTTFLGFQNDMLAVSEVCDLYINPPRKGGGSSCAEALSKGKPAVTLDFGDCSIAAGTDFCVNDLTEMKDTIIKYITDKEFYDIMSKKAINRNKILKDTKKALDNVITDAENSEYWW